MAFLVIVLRNSLPNFHRRGADHGIEVGVVIRSASENFYAQGSFLERLGMTMQRALDDEAQQIWEAFALAEQRAGENALELLPNSIPFGLGFRRPGRCGMTVRIDGLPRLRRIPPASIL